MSNLVSTVPLAPARSSGQAARESARASSVSLEAWLVAGALAVGAWSALLPLTIEWSVNPQYSYGWTVPLLSLYLLIRQWLTRPVANPPAPGSSSRRCALAAAGGLLAAQLPLRWLQEANPDWRPLNWLVVGDFVALCLLAAFLLGGRGWVRQFAFPALFLLVAVPWPERFETACIQGLMHAVTAAVVEVLDWLGVPALQQGNLIQVSSGLIGVEEACSGIRSLQSTLMISLFLGQFYALSPARRVLLVVAGGMLAMTTNLGRALGLVLVNVKQGQQAFDHWHDTAGLAVLLTCLCGLWLVSLWLSRHQPAAERGTKPVVSRSRPLSVGLPIALLLGCLLWPFGVEAAVSLWYRAHESETRANAPLTWSPRWPTGSDAKAEMPVSNFREGEIPDTSRAMLRYTEGRSASWTGPVADGVSPHSGIPFQWGIFFARWAPGQTAAPAAKMHTPRVCLSAAGRPLRRDLGVTWLDAGNHGLRLPFHAYVFDAGNDQELHVFYCLWEDRRVPASKALAAENDDHLTDDELTAHGRFQAALDGRRNLGQRVLEISLLGPPDDATAQAVLARHLPELIQRPPQF